MIYRNLLKLIILHFILIFNNGCLYSPDVYNILLRKLTLNSSAFLWFGVLHDSNMAVNGNRDPNLQNNNCFHVDTAIESQYWMIVDMLRPYNVDYVVVWSRDVLPARLDYFIIGLTSVNYFKGNNTLTRGNYPLCGQYPYKAQVSTGHYLKCNSSLPAYRYLIAQRATNAELAFTICEIEAYPVAEPVWIKYPRMVMNGYEMLSLKTRSTIECIRTCSNIVNCSSVSIEIMPDISTGRMNCILNNASLVMEIRPGSVDQRFDVWQLMWKIL